MRARDRWNLFLEGFYKGLGSGFALSIILILVVWWLKG